MHVKLLIQILTFAFHLWLLFGHSDHLGEKQKDKSFDKYMGKWQFRISFLVALLGHLFFLYLYIVKSMGINAFHTKIFGDFNFWPIPYGNFFFWLGFILVLAGLLLRIWSIHTLGKFFTFEIGIRQGHRVVDAGPYAWIRHPSYSALLLFYAGMYLELGSVVGLLLFLGSMVLFFIFRIRNEEQMLLDHFGREYLDYQKKTKRIIPYIF